MGRRRGGVGVVGREEEGPDNATRPKGHLVKDKIPGR